MIARLTYARDGGKFDTGRVAASTRLSKRIREWLSGRNRTFVRRENEFFEGRGGERREERMSVEEEGSDMMLIRARCTLTQ